MILKSLQSSGATPSSARLHTPASYPLQVRIPVSKVPSDNDLVLAAADDPSCIELQFENTIAAFAVVGEVVVGLCMSLGVSLGVGQAVGEEVRLSVGLRAAARLQLGWVNRSCGGLRL